MSRPPLTDVQLARRKKLQGNISIAGGTLGLTGLALRGGAAATGAGKIGQGVQRATRLKPRPELALKLKDASTGVTTAGAGVGGLGAFNFARYTKEDARRDRLRKSLDQTEVRKSAMMDYGLGQVEQGSAERYEEVSKRLGFSMPKVTPSVAPAFGKPPAPPTKTGFKTPFNTASTKVANPGSTKGSQWQTTQRAKFTPVGKVTAGGLGVGGGGYMLGRRKQPVAKRDWKNISEHERRARDSRRTYNHGKNVAGLGGGAVSVAAGASALTGGNIGRETTAAAHMARSYGKGLKYVAKDPVTRPMFNKMAMDSVKRNPRGNVALAGLGAMAAGGTMMAAGRTKEKHHNRKIAGLRRQRVGKAYDPERNRQRRLDHYATGTSFAAGVSAAGAGAHGVQTARKIGAARRMETATKPSYKGALTQYRAAGKSATRAGAFGVGAIGAAVASERIRGYKKGRGRSYGGPLRLPSQ